MKLILFEVDSVLEEIFGSAPDNIYITGGKIYDGELTPTIYDPTTLQPVEPHYIIKCDDGKYRKFKAKHFMTLEEWREKQIDSIL